jgi:hypothetical protein
MARPLVGWLGSPVTPTECGLLRRGLRASQYLGSRTKNFRLAVSQSDQIAARWRAVIMGFMGRQFEDGQSVSIDAGMYFGRPPLDRQWKR